MFRGFLRREVRPHTLHDRAISRVRGLGDLSKNHGESFKQFGTSPGDKAHFSSRSMSSTSLSSCSLPSICAAILLGLTAPLFGQANGITQPTFAPSEIGTVIHRFNNDITISPSVGLQPAMADYQHGRLYIGSGRDASGGTPLITWWNMSNPRSPVLDQTITLSTGNKPHFVTFWGNFFAPGHQGPSEIWDFNARIQKSTYNSGAGALWRSLQPPFEFNTTNGYGSSPPLLEVATINPTTTVRTRLKLIDLSQLVGFYIGASHPIGNLLVCSASQARGVAVLDVSDPANPRVLSSIVTGNPVYTSMVPVSYTHLTLPTIYSV